MSSAHTNCDVPPLHFHKSKGPHKVALSRHMHYTDTSTPRCVCCGKRFGVVPTEVSVSKRSRVTLEMYDVEAGLHFETQSPLNIAIIDSDGNGPALQRLFSRMWRSMILHPPKPPSELFFLACVCVCVLRERERP
jgi:hypothetical protein